MHITHKHYDMHTYSMCTEDWSLDSTRCLVIAFLINKFINCLHGGSTIFKTTSFSTSQYIQRAKNIKIFIEIQSRIFCFLFYFKRGLIIFLFRKFLNFSVMLSILFGVCTTKYLFVWFIYIFLYIMKCPQSYNG